MSYFSYLSSGLNNLFFRPTLTQQQQEDLKKLKDTIVMEVAGIILRNNYLQQSPQNWEETVFTRQFEEQFPDQFTDRMKEVFSEAAYKPKNYIEMGNILYQQAPKGVTVAKFTNARLQVELKFSHAHFVLSELVWVHCFWYAVDWFAYYGLLNPTCVYDEEELNKLFALIKNPIELSMRDVADCINGIGVGYVMQVGISRAFTSTGAEPIDFEEIPDMDVVEAIKTNTMPSYLKQLMDKVPERLPNYKLMMEDSKKKSDKVQNIQETPQLIEIKNFILEKTKQICIETFDPPPSIFRS